MPDFKPEPHPAPAAQDLDAHSRALLARVADMAAGIPAHELTPDRRRQLSRESGRVFVSEDDHDPSVEREDLRMELPGRTLAARLYRPRGPREGVAGDVLAVFVHGGGWVIGDLNSNDVPCTFLAQRLGCVLLSVDYRKAPEYTFPIPCDDAAEAYTWAAARMASWNCRRIAVMGASAGGHLAAHAMFANPQVPTAAALLFYPVADIDFDNASYVARGAGPGLTAANMRWFWQQFLGEARAHDDVRAVPMRQQWRSLPPPTVLSLAAHDPLHDEGVAYGRLLHESGADVRLLDAPDMAHGFLRQCRVNHSARRHVEAAADALRQCLAVRG